MSTLPWNMYVWPVKRLFQQTNLEDFVRVFFGRNYRFKYENWITFALTRNQFWVNMRNICISYQTSDRNSDSDSHFKLLSKGHGINVNYMYGLLKFGLSEKHKKFEKIFLMVLTNQLIYIKTMTKIFSNYVCFSKRPKRLFKQKIKINRVKKFIWVQKATVGKWSNLEVLSSTSGFRLPY